MSTNKQRYLDPAARPFPLRHVAAGIVAAVMVVGFAATLGLGERLLELGGDHGAASSFGLWQGIADPLLLTLIWSLLVLAGLVLWIVDRYERRLLLFAESRARNRAIVDNMVDGAVHIDAYGRMAGMNAAAEEIFGYRAEELRGQPAALLFPPPLRDRLEAEMLAAPDLGLPAELIGTHRVEGRRRDGTLFPLSLAISEVHVGGYLVYTALARDLSAPPPQTLEVEVLGSAPETNAA